MEKRTKAEVKYGPGMPKARCGICQYFVAPHSCTKVIGPIYKDAWCKLFKRKT